LLSNPIVVGNVIPYPASKISKAKNLPNYLGESLESLLRNKYLKKVWEIYVWH